MRRALILGVVVALSLLATTMAPARAEGGGTGAEGGGTQDPGVGVQIPGGTGGGGGGAGWKCQYYDAQQSSGGSAQVPIPVAGEQYYLVCFDAAGNLVFSGFVVYQPGPAIDPATLAQQAWKTLPLSLPAPRTSPDAGASQYVGLATWLWIDPAQWSSLSATAEVPGLSATVTATPSRSEWSFGDGTDPLVCGAGVPYDQARPAASQSTDCSHTFERASSSAPDGVFHVSVTVYWTVAWTATDGSGGVLPDAFRTSTFELNVGEIEALREAHP